MSKSTVKKLLTAMPKDEIISMVLEMYDARKEAKEYLEFFAHPDEDGKLEEYKKIIKEEFYPSKNREPKTRFAVCRKAVSDYKKLKPSADKLADLMLFYMENACRLHTTMGTCGNSIMTLLRTILIRQWHLLPRTICWNSSSRGFSCAWNGHHHADGDLQMA